jgi:transcriptional regulator with XRE-family HTH domain
MKIADYCKKKGLTLCELAPEVGVSPSGMSRYARGSRIPSPEVMRRIYIVTCGAVTPNDFYGLPDGSLSFANPPVVSGEEG